MRSTRLLEILVIVLTILVVLATFTVVLAVIFPRATENIMGSLRENLGLQPGKGAPQFIQQFRTRAQEGYQYRIKPFFNRITGIFKPAPKVEKKEPVRKKKEISFESCVNAKCHKDPNQRANLRHIYIDHQQHEEMAIECGQCHTDATHPKPAAVKEATCLGCHKKQGIATSCDTCHAPGSILDPGIIAPEKTASFLAGRTSRQIVPAGFEVARTEACSFCHNKPEFCNRCHLMFHKNDPTWTPTHGKRVLGGEFKMNVCWQCHPAGWCATKCHSNPARRPVGPILPVPIQPLEVP